MPDRSRSRTRLLALVVICSSAAAPSWLCAQAPAVDAVEKKLQGAEGLLGRGQPELARQEFDEFLRTYPRDSRVTRARFGRALALQGLGDFDAAVAELEAVTGDKNFTRRDDALAVLASCALSAGKPDKTVTAAGTLLKEFPQSPQVEGATVNRAQALYRLRKYDESLAEVAAMLKAYPNSPHRASALYVAALDQRAMNNETAATTLLQEIVAKYPTAPFVYDAQLLIADSLSSQGKTADALNHLRRVEETAPESKKPAVRFAMGSTLSRAGKYAEAMATFDDVAEKYRGTAYAGPAKLQRAVAQLKSGLRVRAREALLGVARDHPELASSANYWMARCDLLDGKFAEAREELAKLVNTRMPEASEAEFDLAYCELMTGRDDAALKRLEAYRAAYPFSPHDAEAVYYQASALHRLGQYDKSLSLCETLVGKKSSVQRPAAILRGENLLMQKKYAEADAALSALEQGGSGDETMRLAWRRAQAAYFAGDFKGAEERLGKVVKDLESPQDLVAQEAAFVLADARLQQNKYAEAAAAFKAYLVAGKAHAAEATFKLAMSQLGAKDRKAAGETLAGLLRGDIKNEWVQRAWFESGSLAYNEKNKQEAARAMETLLAASPAEAIAAPAMYLQSRIELDAGRAAEAAKVLGSLLEKYPRHTLAEDAMFVRGVALKDAKDLAGATAQFDAYIRAYPKGKYIVEAWHQGAACLAQTDKASEAVKILAQLAADKGTRSDGVLYDLAWAHRAAGNKKAAGETYEALLKEFPQSTRAAASRVELAELLGGESRPADAAAMLVAALRDPNIDGRSRAVALYRLGHAYLQTGQAEEAGKMFDTFAAENPKDPLMPAAVVEAGGAYTQAGKVDEAKKRLGRVIKEFAGSEAAKLAVIRMGDAQNQAGEYDTAAKTFEAWMKEHPSDALTPQAEFGMGWSLENRGKFAEARERYGRVIAADNSSVGARAQFQIGETYFAEKKFGDAARELLKVDIQYNAPVWAARALYEAGRAFEQLEEPVKAKQQFEECVRKYPNSDVAPLAAKRVKSKE